MLYVFLMIMSISMYRQVYEYSAHPVYLAFFALLFVGYLLYAWSLKIAARKREVQLAILAEAEKRNKQPPKRISCWRSASRALEKREGCPLRYWLNWRRLLRQRARSCNAWKQTKG
ncbi:hypothetical protein CWS02_02345 [Enterobacter sp. EA-1]|nr:hypothetical protein CWS02_02345 [Enterobacter sp. EA-1]